MLISLYKVFIPSGIGNSLHLKEIYTLSDSDYMKMLYYTGDEIHLSVVTSFRTERFGSQHSNPQPLLTHGRLLSPTPIFLPGFNIYSFLIRNSFDFHHHSGHSSWKFRLPCNPHKGTVLKEN